MKNRIEKMVNCSVCPIHALERRFNIEICNYFDLIFYRYRKKYSCKRYMEKELY